MTPIVSDIRILDNLLALNLNVSLWSARRKMSQEDLGGAELPPEDLASLGSKRIADPATLGKQLLPYFGDVPPEKAKEAMNRRNLWIGAAAAITLALLAAIALSMT